MNLVAFLIVTAISTRAGTAVEGWKPPLDACTDEPTVYRSCQGLDNSFQCADLIEACALRAEPDSVRRIDSVLSLLVGDGRWLRLVDHESVSLDFELSPIAKNSMPRYYSFIEAPAQAPWYVVHEQRNEYISYLLIHRKTGRIVGSKERPLFSPSGERLAAIGSWAEVGGGKLHIWSLSGDQLVRELMLDLPRKPTDVWRTEYFVPDGWDGDTAFRYRHQRRRNHEWVYEPKRAELTENGWKP